MVYTVLQRHHGRTTGKAGLLMAATAAFTEPFAFFTGGGPASSSWARGTEWEWVAWCGGGGEAWQVLWQGRRK